MSKLEYGTVEHFAWFCQYYLSIVMFDYQLEWFEHFMGNRWSILLAPRSHGKSLFMQCLLVYIICHDPTIRILIASDKEDLANQFSKGIQNDLEHIQESFPDDFTFLKDRPWKLTEWYLRPSREEKKQRFPTMKTIAGRAGITGRRCDILVFDDILEVENVREEKMRKKLEEWIRKAVLPTQDRSSKEKRLIIGTRKHPDDWYAKLLKNRFYAPRVDELYTDVDGVRTYLWPYDPRTETGWNDEVVERVKEDYKDNPSEFYQEYFNLPSPPGGQHFKGAWVTAHYYHELPPSNRLTYYMGIDPSGGSKTKNASWLAIAVIAFDMTEQVIYVVDLYREKMSVPEQEDVIVEYCKKWRLPEANLENTFYNEYFSNQIIEKWPNIHPINHREHRLRGCKETDKEARIENIVGAYFKRGLIRMRHPDLSPMTTTFLDYEFLPFPDGQKDMLDALNMAVDLIQWRAHGEGPLFVLVP